MRLLKPPAVLTSLVAVLLFAAVGAAAGAFGTQTDPFGSDQVGQTVGSRILLPTNQWISPAGQRILEGKARLSGSALSPDGTHLAVLSIQRELGAGLMVFDLRAGTLAQTIGGDDRLGDNTVAADAPLYSRDGRTLWVSQSRDVLRFDVAADGTVSSSPSATIPLKATHGDEYSSIYSIFRPNGDALPSGMALSADGSRLYVALNGNNTLATIDTRTNSLTSQIPVGNAPRQVVLRGGIAYVSDEGGRPARSSDVTNFSDGTRIVSDPQTGAPVSGTVSVVDLRRGRVTRTIPVGLEPTALLLRGNALFVANSGGDSVSIVDTRRNRVVRTLGVNPVPGQSIGSYPDSVSMPDPAHLLVSLGRDNAVADYAFSGLRRPIRLLGLIPTDWYPVAAESDAALGGELVITNDKGVGSRGPAATAGSANPTPAYQTHLETGSVTVLPVPRSGATLRADTQIVFADNNWGALPAIDRGSGDTVPGIVPPRLGLPSKIKHVFVIVRENRTFDQVLGDLGQGNGDPALTEFGAPVTPNAHALANRFGVLDNFYAPGTLSADGHNWIVQADANDYVEREFGAFSRSYPASGGDALAYQRVGFLWDAAMRRHLSVRNFGEYVNFMTLPASGGPSWSDWYRDSQILEGKASGPLPVPIDRYRNFTDVPALNRVTNPYFPLFDLDIPDQYRVDIWEREFRRNVQSGQLPRLTLMTLMSDHTATGSTSDPNPASEVADNDLALGRVVSDISHSRFWGDSAIFVVEDDAQAGVDHVDGHRTVAFVISPYSRRGVDDQYFTQLNMVRTIEQILGLHAMNQNDAGVAPMYGAFTPTPDLAPYDYSQSLIPLAVGASGNPLAGGASGGPLATLASGARPGSAMPSRYLVPPSAHAVFAAWMRWGRRQHFGGAHPTPDFADPAQLNRFDWYATHGWRVPYPGDRSILTPAQASTGAGSSRP